MIPIILSARPISPAAMLPDAICIQLEEEMRCAVQAFAATRPEAPRDYAPYAGELYAKFLPEMGVWAC